MWDDRALLPVYYYPRGTVESGRDNTLDSFARKNRVEVFTRTENKDKFPDINKTNQSWKVFGHHKVSLLLLSAYVSSGHCRQDPLEFI